MTLAVGDTIYGCIKDTSIEIVWACKNFRKVRVEPSPADFSPETPEVTMREGNDISAFACRTNSPAPNSMTAMQIFSLVDGSCGTCGNAVYEKPEVGDDEFARVVAECSF